MLHNACHVAVVDGRRARRAPPACCQQSRGIVANRGRRTRPDAPCRAGAGSSGCRVPGRVRGTTPVHRQSFEL